MADLRIRYIDPSYTPKLGFAKPGDVGLDFPVRDRVVILPGAHQDLRTGISVKLPDDCWGLVTARSSTFARRRLLAFPGVIDSGYTGEVFAFVCNLSGEPVTVEPGESLVQLIVVPKVGVTLRVVEDLGQTERGDTGFGSSGVSGGVAK